MRESFIGSRCLRMWRSICISCPDLRAKAAIDCSAFARQLAVATIRAVGGVELFHDPVRQQAVIYISLDNMPATISVARPHFLPVLGQRRSMYTLEGFRSSRCSRSLRQGGGYVAPDHGPACCVEAYTIGVVFGLPDTLAFVLAVEEKAFAARGQETDAEALQLGIADVVWRLATSRKGHEIEHSAQ